MLYILMYHHLRGLPPENPSWGNEYALWEKHITWIMQRYDIVLPGEALSSYRPSVCLTFDDASYDVYTHVYPLFKKWNLRGVVAVPTSYIADTCCSDQKKRLACSPDMRRSRGHFLTPCSPLCSWEELYELAHSGHFSIASHSRSHIDLTQKKWDDGVLYEEIEGSRQELEKKLLCRIDSFVYPFGRWNVRIQKKVQNSYPYAMRIGNCANASWSPRGGLLYRICAHHMTFPEQPLTLWKRFIYRGKGWIKSFHTVDHI